MAAHGAKLARDAEFGAVTALAAGAATVGLDSCLLSDLLRGKFRAGASSLDVSAVIIRRW
jgi:hypothetical protein